MHVKTCRICGRGPLTKILSLGKMPPVNYFPLKEDSAVPIKKYPLNFCLCVHCGLAQLDEVIPPEKLFQNYHYLTSASTPLIEHFHHLAQECAQRHFISKGAKALDIGANDGTLLLALKKHGVKTLGVDPSLNAGKAAEKVGIKVLPFFFNKKTAGIIHSKYGSFQLITSTNVFAHTHNIKSFLEGVKTLLAPGGVFILEFAHLLDMIVKTQFDVIYHEHLSYFSLRPLIYLFEKFGFEIFDVKKILTQGGSLRIYVRRKKKGVSPAASNHLETILMEEEENHINEVETLRRFAKDVRQFRADIRTLISNIKKAGHKIVGYGAPAKGVILLNYCGLGKNEIDYIVDSTPLKQGRYFPGSHIPVYAEQKWENDQWDYLLLLAWNFQDAIFKKIAPYREKGVKVIIPFPKLRVI